MSDEKRPGNRRKTPRCLTQAVEEILLRFTDMGNGRSLSYSEIAAKLEEEYQIIVDSRVVQKSADAIQRWREDKSVVKNTFSVEVTKNNPEAINGKQKVCVNRDKDWVGMVEYLVRYLESISKNSNMDLQSMLLSQLDEESQERIKRKVKNQKKSESMPRLSQTMRTIQELETEIDDREYVNFEYPSPDGTMKKEEKYLPLCLHFDGDHYYLAATGKWEKFYKKFEGGNEKGPSPRIFRVDKIQALRPAGKVTNMAEKEIAERIKAAEWALKAGVDGIIRGDIAKVEIVCTDPLNKRYVLNKFQANPEFTEDTFDEQRGHYYFMASRQGFERWLPKWIHCVEVKSFKMGTYDRENNSWVFDGKEEASVVVDKVIGNIMESKAGKDYKARRQRGAEREEEMMATMD